MPYKIVFFDIDGTLINTRHTISADTIAAVQALHAKGIKVAIATGRSPYHLLPIAKQLGINTYVSFNGSYVVSEEKMIYGNCIPKETLALLDTLSLANGHPLVHLSADTCYANAENHPHVVASFESLRIEPPGTRARYWDEQTIYQAFLYCQEQNEPLYEEMFQQVSHIRWHPLAIDIMPLNGSKANGIEAVLNHYGLSPEEAVAFGDGLNDREMLSYVGMGIAMGNAHEALKPCSKMITRHVDDGGIPYGLQKIGLLR